MSKLRKPINLFYTYILLAVDKDNLPKDKLADIEKQLDGKTKELLCDCEQYLGLTGDKHYSWMIAPYRNKRSSFFGLLDSLQIISSFSEDKSIENALRFIKHHRSSHKEWIEVDGKTTPNVELSLLPDSWYSLVTDVKKGEKVTKINRHNYELAVLHVLSGDLACGDVDTAG